MWLALVTITTTILRTHFIIQAASSSRNPVAFYFVRCELDWVEWKLKLSRWRSANRRKVNVVMSNCATASIRSKVLRWFVKCDVWMTEACHRGVHCIVAEFPVTARSGSNMQQNQNTYRKNQMKLANAFDPHSSSRSSTKSLCSKHICVDGARERWRWRWSFVHILTRLHFMRWPHCAGV